MSSKQPTSPDITRRYLAFFRERGHLELPGSPLVVPGGGTSFVIAGMQPMLPYLRGQTPPPAPRLTGWQRCLRTDDVDAVGTNGRKLTSFHMLGNWSIGDYGKREAIGYALDLLDVLGVDLSSIWITIFGGSPDDGLPSDEVTREEWLRAGIPAERIVPLGTEDNLWTMGGPGPCGPCTELYIDRGASLGCERPDCPPGCACERFLEIWNLVFMEYEWLPDGRYEPLPLRSVDTGMGLERIAAVLQDRPTVFDIDLFSPAQERLSQLASTSGTTPQAVHEVRARRMIVDHARAALYAGLEGVGPGHVGRGSVVRRLIRRAARQGHILGIERPFLGELLPPLAEGHGDLLTPDVRMRVPEVAAVLGEEERRFTRVLTSGLRLLEQLEPDANGFIPGARLFELHAARGFPPDLAADVLSERGLSVDWSSFDEAMNAHRDVSRQRASRRFGVG